MSTMNSIQVTILASLILITFVSVGFIAYPFGLQVATAQNATQASANGGNQNITVTNIRPNNSAIQPFFEHSKNISANAALPLFVLFPEADQGYKWGGYSENQAGQLVIEVLFSKAVDKASVIPQSNLILAMERNANAPATLTWDFNDRFLTIVTNDRLSDLCSYDPDCFFSLTLDGIEPGVIRAADGSLLNGGFNDYWTGFVIVG